MRTNYFSETCRNLRERGHTLGEIIAITHRPKGSVYFHIRQIKLSPKKAGRIARNHILRIKEFNHARKGKSARSFKTFDQWDERKIAHIIARDAYISFGAEKGISQSIL